MIFDALKRLITAIVLLTTLALIYFFFTPLLLSICFLLILAIIISLELPRIGSLFLAPIYPTFSFFLLIILNHSPTERPLLIAIFVITWSFDTGSYLFGTIFGKIKIIPKLSPKKTLEGLIGGTAVSLCVSYLAFTAIGLRADPLFFIFFIILANIFAFMGDMLVSFLKRRAGVKDTGSLLPAHGGFLDRFDGIIPVTILVYLTRVMLLD